MIDLTKVQGVDSEIYDAMMLEFNRQNNNIELIASENVVSEAVLQAMGSHLTNKYAEGYPGKRYYGGCEYVDIVENIARDRVKKIFGAEHANVQPHSGAQANIAVYFGLLNPGDTIVGMDLAHGGHLTHGSPVNISGKYFNFVPYGVSKETETIDYDMLETIVKENKPKMVVGGASAYPRKIDFKRMAEIAHKYGALLMIDMAHIAGLVAAGEHENPFPHADIVTTTTHKTLRGPRGGLIMCKEEFAKAIDKAIFPGTQGGPLMHVIAAKAVCFKEAMTDEFKAYQHQIILNAQALSSRLMENGIRLVSGGTDNHLMLMDVHSMGSTGKEIEALLDKAHITANKNTIPFETLSPFKASGVRLGTPAVTSRGFNEDDCRLVADLITRIVNEKEAAVEEVSKEVAALCAKYPLYR